MNKFIYQHRAWLLYTILIDHKDISLQHVYEILNGSATNIRFSDYYSLIFAKQFINLLANNENESCLVDFINKFPDVFLENELQIVRLLIKSWYVDKNIIICSDEKRQLYIDGKIGFNDYFEGLIFRQEL